MSQEGASQQEQLIEACRRNNTELLEEVLNALPTPQDRARLINEARDPIGNSALHLAAAAGNYECLDILLDQEGVEVDPQNRLYGDTPLHSAVRYSISEPEHGAFIAEELIEAGADPRIRNKNGQIAKDLCSPSNQQLIGILQSALLAATMGGAAAEEAEEPSEEAEGEASASDSDSDYESGK